MSHKFRIYSTEVIATLDPDALAVAPITLIAFDEDPDNGNYTPVSNTADRGSVWKTLGGNVIQDFGIIESDGLISFSGTDSLSSAIVTALQTAYAVIDGQWYFTDGFECWKIQFSRQPAGFQFWRNILYAQHGRDYFSYIINLLVLSKEI